MKTATNPQTGEAIYWNGQEWLPLQTATHQETGEVIGLADGKIIPLKPPRAPGVRDVAGPGKALYSASDTLKEELTQYVPEVRRRASTIVGQELTPADIPKVVGVGVSQTARAAGAVASSFLGGLIPESIKEGAEDLYKQVQQTEGFQTAAQAISEGYEAYQDYKKVNPTAAEQLETIVDLTALFSPRPDLPTLPTKGAVSKAKKEASQAVRDSKTKGVTLLLTPDQPELTDIIEEKGILRKKVFTPSDFDNQVISTVTDMKGVKPNRSYTYNYREVQKEVAGAKAATDQMITAQNKKINSIQFTDDMESAIQQVLNDPLVRAAPGDVQKELENLTEILMESVTTNGSDLVGVLSVRRRFDDLMNGFTGTQNAKRIAGRTLRNVLNQTLKDNTRGDKLHNLLTKQFHGITALEEMLPKRNREGSNAFARISQNLQSIDLLPSTILALTATGSVAVNQIGGPGPALLAGGLGLGAYGTVKLMRPKNALRVYASLLSATDEALNTAGITASMAEQLKIDRALIVDLMDETRQEAKEEATNNE